MGADTVAKPPNPSVTMISNARWTSSSVVASSSLASRLRAFAAASIPANTGAIPGFRNWPSSANFLPPGTNSRSNSSHFGAISDAISDWPVTFPPGRERLSTIPAMIGSPIGPKTMGTFFVAATAALVAVVVSVRITSGSSASSSPASAGRRPRTPSEYLSSITRLRPSIQPSSRSRPRMTLSVSAVVCFAPSTRIEILAPRAGCCPNASGTPSTRPTSPRKPRRFTRSPGERSGI